MANVTFQYNPSDEPDLTDDEYKVFVDGVEVPFAIQVGGKNAFIVNEYSPKDESFWMKQHKICPSLLVAKAKAEILALAYVAK